MGESVEQRLRVVIDFDGVLHSYASGWTGPQPTDPPEPGAVEFVQWLLNSGLEVVVVSARAGHPGGRGAIKDWLARHGFPPLKVSDRKVPAVAYVDDRAVRYRRNDWERCRAEVSALARTP